VKQKATRAAVKVVVAVVVLQLTATAQVGKSFEVASIRPKDPREGTRVSSRAAGKQFEIVSISAWALVARAFDMDDVSRVVAPDWARRELFDIRAVMPDGATAQDIPAMLRALVVERFQLKTHIEQRPYQVYELVVGPSGPKFREVPPADDLQTTFASNDPGALDRISGLPGDELRHIVSSNGIRKATARTSYFSKMTPSGVSELDATRITMAEFIAEIRPRADRPIVDKTGLTAIYQFKILLPPPRISGATQALLGDRLNSDPPGVSLSRSLEELGLKLERKDTPADFIVIDKIERPLNN
jgi:uncharacterized protein (TIGR03435 family)